MQHEQRSREEPDGRERDAVVVCELVRDRADVRDVPTDREAERASARRRASGHGQTTSFVSAPSRCRRQASTAFVERHPLEVDSNPSCSRVLDQLAVAAGDHVVRDGQRRVPEDVQGLSAYEARGDGRLRTRRLPDLNDPRERGGCRESRYQRSAPEGIDHERRTDSRAGLPKGRGEIIHLVQLDHGVRAERPRALECFGAPPRGHDAAGPEQLRRLHRDGAERAGRAEDEDGLAFADRRAPGQTATRPRPRRCRRRLRGPGPRRSAPGRRACRGRRPVRPGIRLARPRDLACRSRPRCPEGERQTPARGRLPRRLRRTAAVVSRRRTCPTQPLDRLG